MAKLALLLTFTWFLFLNVPAGDHAIKVKADYVYICNSSSSYAYHKTKDCRGLNRCTREIKKVTKTEAVNEYGRKACKICYN